MKEESDTELYGEAEVSGMLEDDELDAAEEGFMLGYYSDYEE